MIGLLVTLIGTVATLLLMLAGIQFVAQRYYARALKTKKPESILWSPGMLADMEHKMLGTDVFGDPIDRKEWGLDPWGHGEECVLCNPPKRYSNHRLCPGCGLDTIDGSACTACKDQWKAEEPDVYLGDIKVKIGAHITYVHRQRDNTVLFTLSQDGKRYGYVVPEPQAREIVSMLRRRFTLRNENWETAMVDYWEEQDRRQHNARRARAALVTPSPMAQVNYVEHERLKAEVEKQMYNEYLQGLQQGLIGNEPRGY